MYIQSMFCCWFIVKRIAEYRKPQVDELGFSEMDVCLAASDNCWTAFCVFHAHFWENTHSFKMCALKTQ